MIRAHQPGSEPIDIPETIPNPIVVPKPHLLRQNPLPRSQFGSRRGCPAQHELPAARVREGQQAMAEYQAELRAMREKTARLRALRLARDSANQKTPPTNGRGVA